MRDVRLGSYDPLVDEAVQNLSVSFSLAIEELLVTGEGVNVAQEDDVVFDARDDAVHNFLFLRRNAYRRNCNGGRKENSASEKAGHQKVDPRLKKI